MIEKSGLIGLLDSHMRNESLVDIENHSDLYYLIFQVRCNDCTRKLIFIKSKESNLSMLK